MPDRNNHFLDWWDIQPLSVGERNIRNAVGHSKMDSQDIPTIFPGCWAMAIAGGNPEALRHP